MQLSLTRILRLQPQLKTTGACQLNLMVTETVGRLQSNRSCVKVSQA